MRTFKTILLEKLKINGNTNAVDTDFDYIDSLPVGPEKSEAVADYLKAHYGELFTEYRIMKTGNIKLGEFTNPRGKWYDGQFTLAFYAGNYVMRRSTPRYGAVAKMADEPSFKVFIEKVDKSLIRNGYDIN